jgi:hypothetical protein
MLVGCFCCGIPPSRSTIKIIVEEGKKIHQGKETNNNKCIFILCFEIQSMYTKRYVSIKHNMKMKESKRHRHKVRTPLPPHLTFPFFNTTHFCHTYVYVFKSIAFEIMWVLNFQVKKNGVLCYDITLVLKLAWYKWIFNQKLWAQWASIKGTNICK